MKKVVCLSDLKENTASKVEFVKGPIKIKKRLSDLGFTKGASVKIINASSNRGSYLIELKGYLLALRNNAASLVSVSING